MVFDERFAPAVQFGRAAERAGVAAHPIRGDMTSFWYHELDARWKASPVAIAGMTAHGPMFCFEILARDHGLRLVYQAEHACAAGEVRHTISGPMPLLRRSASLEAAGAVWPARLAEMVAACPAEPRASGALDLVTPTEATAPLDEPLFTWVIAPVSRT